MSLKLQILNQLSVYMKTNGFTWRRPSEEMYKNIPVGRLGYFVVFNYYRPILTWTVRPVAMIRLNAVEEIFHKTSGFEERYHRTSYTIGCTLTEYLTGVSDLYERLEFRDDVEIEYLALELFARFNNDAKPYYEKFANVEAMDRLLNDQPDIHSIHGGVEPLRCQRGLILAKLARRVDYDHLEQVYRAKLESFNDGFYLPAFENLRLLLRSM